MDRNKQLAIFVVVSLLLHVAVIEFTPRRQLEAPQSQPEKLPRFQLKSESNKSQSYWPSHLTLTLTLNPSLTLPLPLNLPPPRPQQKSLQSSLKASQLHNQNRQNLPPNLRPKKLNQRQSQLSPKSQHRWSCPTWLLMAAWQFKLANKRTFLAIHL